MQVVRSKTNSLLHILQGYVIFHRESNITFSSPLKLYLFYLENLLTPKMQITSYNWLFYQKQTT